MSSLLLNIIKLTNLVYNRKYLVEKLLEVIDRLGIIYAILSVTRDNASPNNTILNKFKAIVIT